MTILAEQRATEILRLEHAGHLDPACAGCRAHYDYYLTRWEPGHPGPFAPSHRASPRCQSGKRPHCTCDACF